MFSGCEGCACSNEPATPPSGPPRRGGSCYTATDESESRVIAEERLFRQLMTSFQRAKRTDGWCALQLKLLRRLSRTTADDGSLLLFFGPSSSSTRKRRTIQHPPPDEQPNPPAPVPKTSAMVEAVRQEMAAVRKLRVTNGKSFQSGKKATPYSAEGQSSSTLSEGVCREFPALEALRVENLSRKLVESEIDAIVALLSTSQKVTEFSAYEDDDEREALNILNAIPKEGEDDVQAAFLSWPAVLARPGALSSRVTSVKLEGCGLDAAPERFAELAPSLETLSFRRNRLSSARQLCDAVRGLERLRDLDVSRNELQNDTQFTPWIALGSVRRLNLAENRLTSFRGLELCLGLTDLDLRSNHLADLTELSLLSVLPLLQRISLEGNPCAKSHYRVPALALLARDDRALRRRAAKTKSASWFSSSSSAENTTTGQELVSDDECLPALDGKPATKRELLDVAKRTFATVVGVSPVEHRVRNDSQSYRAAEEYLEPEEIAAFEHRRKVRSSSRKKRRDRAESFGDELAKESSDDGQGERTRSVAALQTAAASESGRVSEARDEREERLGAEDVESSFEEDPRRPPPPPALPGKQDAAVEEASCKPQKKTTPGLPAEQRSKAITKELKFAEEHPSIARFVGDDVDHYFKSVVFGDHSDETMVLGFQPVAKLPSERVSTTRLATIAFVGDERRPLLDARGRVVDPSYHAVERAVIVVVTTARLFIFFEDDTLLDSTVREAPKPKLVFAPRGLAGLAEATIGFKFDWLALDFDDGETFHVTFPTHSRDATLSLVNAIVPVAKELRAAKKGLRGEAGRRGAVKVNNDDAHTLDLLARVAFSPNNDADGVPLLYASCVQFWQSRPDVLAPRVFVVTNKRLYLLDDDLGAFRGLGGRDRNFDLLESLPWRRARQLQLSDGCELTLTFVDPSYHAGFLKNYRTWRLRFGSPTLCHAASDLIHARLASASSPSTLLSGGGSSANPGGSSSAATT